MHTRYQQRCGANVDQIQVILHSPPLGMNRTERIVTLHYNSNLNLYILVVLTILLAIYACHIVHMYVLTLLLSCTFV